MMANVNPVVLNDIADDAEGINMSKPDLKLREKVFIAYFSHFRGFYSQGTVF